MTQMKTRIAMAPLVVFLLSFCTYSAFGFVQTSKWHKSSHEASSRIIGSRELKLAASQQPLSPDGLPSSYNSQPRPSNYRRSSRKRPYEMDQFHEPQDPFYHSSSRSNGRAMEQFRGPRNRAALSSSNALRANNPFNRISSSRDRQHPMEQYREPFHRSSSRSHQKLHDESRNNRVLSSSNTVRTHTNPFHRLPSGNRQQEQFREQPQSPFSRRNSSSRSNGHRSIQQDIVRSLNFERSRRNLRQFQPNRGLQKVAQGALSVLTKQNGSIDYNAAYASLDNRIKASGYNSIDAKRYNCRSWEARSTEIYFQGWHYDDTVEDLVDSLLHNYRDDLLSSAYDEIGVSVRGDVLVITLGTILFEEKRPFTKQQEIAFADQVFRLTNDERMNHGLPPLSPNGLLDNSAYYHAQDMYHRDFFSHNSPEGISSQQRIKEGGYLDVVDTVAGSWQTCVGENIAVGQQTPEQVVHDWMNSPGHRKNILSSKFMELGIGVYGEHWVQHFGMIRQTPSHFQ